MHKKPKYFYPASSGKRIAALLLDISLVYLILKAAILLATPYGLEIIVSGLSVFIYFVIIQGLLGASLGKRLVGIRLIVYGEDEKPGALRLLGRETIGKLLSVLTLFIGIIFAIFDNENQTLHDKIFRTQVISDTPPTKFSFSVFMLQTSIVMSIFSIVSLYLLLYTSAPINQIVKQLELRGIHLTKVSGNIINGFTVGEIHSSTDKADIHIKKAVVKYESLLNILSEKKFQLRRISAAEVNLHFKEDEMIKKIVSQTKRQKIIIEELHGDKLSQLQSFHLIVNRVEIRKLKIIAADGKVTRVDRIHVANAAYENDSVEIDKLWIDSSVGRVIVDNLEYFKSKNLFAVQSVDILIRRAFAPQIISRDLDLSMKAKFNLNSNELVGTFWGLRSSIRAHFNKGILDLKAYNLQPQWYFKNSPATSVVNFEFNGNPEMALAAPIKNVIASEHKGNTDATSDNFGTLLKSIFPNNISLTALFVDGIHKRAPASY